MSTAISKCSYNRFDYYIILTISLLSLGYFGTPLYPARIWAIMFMPQIFMKLKRKRIFIPQYVRNFFSVWVICGLFSLIWSYNIIEGIKYFFYFLCNIVSFFSIYIFSKRANNVTKSILLGWLIMFLLTIPIALYEFSSGMHVGIEVQDSDKYIAGLDGNMINRKYAFVTFGALNTYNVIICYSLAFILVAFFVYKYKIQQLFLWILLLFAMYIILMNASRGALLCFILSLLVFFYYIRTTRLINRSYFFLVLGVAVIIIFQNINLFVGQIVGRLTNTELFSDESRTEIYLRAIRILAGTLGIGVGIGGNDVAMKLASPSAISATHNIFIEFVLQFGIIPFYFFIVFLLKMYLGLYKANSIHLKFLGAILLIVSVPLFIIDSGYLLTSSLWIYWGSIFALLMNNNYCNPNLNNIQND